MQKIADDTFLLKIKSKYCPHCGKYTVARENTICPNCSGDWTREGGRCHNCKAAIDPGWNYCELCGVETARVRRLKRAKQLSHRAKAQKVARSELPPLPPPKSPDLFGPDPTGEELDLLEATLNTYVDQQSEKTPDTVTTTVTVSELDFQTVGQSSESSQI